MKKLFPWLCLAVIATWDYAAIAKLAGFKLYYEGVYVCGTTDPAARTLTCDVASLSYGKSSFTMTAVTTDGVESDQSGPYVVQVKPPSPGNVRVR